MPRTGCRSCSRRTAALSSSSSQRNRGSDFGTCGSPLMPRAPCPNSSVHRTSKRKLAQDLEADHHGLAKEPFDYAGLRPYQREAVETIEAALAEGRRDMLVAMATGTGKTRTCVALMYRLLKHKRFRRILFLVDRNTLGEQAERALDNTELE